MRFFLDALLRRSRGLDRRGPRGLWCWVALLLALGPVPAADKNGVSPNTISLPKGPGSIEGLGEAFQPTLNTGTAKYAIRLAAPPGTAGRAPELALRYEGGVGNGCLGYGWSLPLASIQRQTDQGIPRYVDGANNVDDDWDGEIDEADESDVFINELKEELVPVANGAHTDYFCKNEGAFIRYRRVDDYWVGTQPDGTRMIFGQSADARLVDPDRPERVFRWLLEQVADTQGNTIRYRYTSFAGDANRAQRYSAEIEYGPGAPPWGNFHFVVFEYEDRPDWFEDCRSGFPLRTGKRLARIMIGTQGPDLAGHARGDVNGDGITDCLNRIYELRYQVDSFWSLLRSVTPVGADGTNTLPASTFAYTECSPAGTISASEAAVGAENEPAAVFDNDAVDLLDLNGDGLPDLVRTYEGLTHHGYLNQGEVLSSDGRRRIKWSEAVYLEGLDARAWNLNLADDAVHLADMDGDGLSDLVQVSVDTAYYFLNQGGKGPPGWGARARMAIQDFPPPSPFGPAAGDVRTADINFDKRTDILRSSADGSFYHVWFNLGPQRYSRRVRVVPPTGYVFSNPGVTVADFNGDRVPDLVWIRPSSINVTAGLGHGNFAPEISVPLPDGSLSLEQVQKARFQDVTGDGLADLVIERAAGSTLWFWVNQGNYTLDSRRQVTDLPTALDAHPEVRWVDMNGNGTTDYVWADRARTPKMQMIDLGQLMGCVPKPHLLKEIANGLGRVTRIEYRTSTDFLLADGTDAQGNYTYSWPDPLPFPVDTVARVVTLDSLGHEYATEFRYHDGYYDAAEKQFRGFARVEQVDVGDPTAPTLITRSHFDTGRVYEVMKGKLQRLTTEQEDGKVFWEETTAWTDPPRVLMTGLTGTNVAYAHPVATVKRIQELGQGTEKRLESEFAYDPYGNQTTNADYGIVEHGDRSASDDERISTTEYALNTNAWILRIPKRTEIKDENGAVISRAEFYYDDETFSGNNLGEVTLGNLTMKREWIVPATNNAFITSARTKYDHFGNPVTLLDPLAVAPGGTVDVGTGHAREIAYDARFHTYPVTETIHLGNRGTPLVFQVAYDEGFGTVNSSTDFNTNTTTYGYDTFARLIRIVKPLDTLEFPTVEYDYALAVPVGLNGLVNCIKTSQLDKPEDGSRITAPASRYLLSRQFVDGLGRKLMTKQEAEPAPGSSTPRAVVTDATQFNARQKSARVLNPFFTVGRQSSGALDDFLAFENIEAPGWQGQFHNEGNLVTLDLAAAHATLTDCDATLRPTQVTNPDGTQRRTVYEPLLMRSFDENDTDPASPDHNTPMVHSNDGLGRLIQVDEITRLDDNGYPLPSDGREAGGEGSLRTWTTRYQYDLNDQLTRITDSQNNVKTFAYDGLKRKTFMNDPDRGVMHFVYDDASNLTVTIDAKGQRITYTYDGANRIRTETYHDRLPLPSWRGRASLAPPGGEGQGEGANVVYHYDTAYPDLVQGDNTTATAHHVKGALAWVEDLSGEEHTSFDTRGRVEWVVKRIPDPQLLSRFTNHASLVSYKTAFAYDSLDRLTRLTYPDADQLRYEYTDRNLLQRIPGGPSGSMISNILYPPSAQNGQIDYGNGIRTTYAYDSRLRLARLTTLAPPRGEGQPGSPKPSGEGGGVGLPLIDFAYSFDGVSNIKSIEDRRPGSAVPEGDPRRNTQLFQYDDLYRLTRVQYSFAVPSSSPSSLEGERAGVRGASFSNDGEINYRYDRIGNMLAQTSTLNHQEKGLPVANLGTMESGGIAGRWYRTGRAGNDPPGPHALTRITPLSAPGGEGQGEVARNYPYMTFG